MRDVPDMAEFEQFVRVPRGKLARPIDKRNPARPALRDFSWIGLDTEESRADRNLLAQTCRRASTRDGDHAGVCAGEMWSVECES